MSEISTKTALVTGANKGIGREVVRQLATLGYKVFLGARDEQRGKKAVDVFHAAGLNDVHFLHIDVTSDESVLKAAETLSAQISVLDVLVNNAGLSSYDGVNNALTEPIDEMKAMYEVNVFGPVRTTRAFVELLKKSKAGRVVNVGSSMGSLIRITDKSHFLFPFVMNGYSSSKSALSALSIGFSKTLAEFNIKVNVADPGMTPTDLNGHNGTDTIEQAAQPIIFLSTLPDDGPTGSFYSKDGVVAW